MRGRRAKAVYGLSEGTERLSSGPGSPSIKEASRPAQASHSPAGTQDPRQLCWQGEEVWERELWS